MLHRCSRHRPIERDDDPVTGAKIPRISGVASAAPFSVLIPSVAIQGDHCGHQGTRPHLKSVSVALSFQNHTKGQGATEGRRSYDRWTHHSTEAVMFTLGHLIAARKLAAASENVVESEQVDAPVRKKVSRSEIERLFRSDLQAKTEMAQRAAL